VTGVLDWFGATPLANPERLIAAISTSLNGIDIARVVRSRGQYTYHHLDTALDGLGVRVFDVLSGGSNSAPHLRSSGHYAEPVAQALRLNFPGFALTRADLALDFCSPGAWDSLRAECQAIATEFGIKWAVLGDDRPEGVRDPLQGRTFYMGSRSSPVFLRGYEKGLQLLSAGVVLSPGEEPPSPHHVRVELEFKPQKREAKLRAASLSYQQMWGSSPWSRATLRRILGLDVERIVLNQRKVSEAARASRHAAVQYRKAFQEYIEQNGGDPAVLLALFEEVWRDMDNHRFAA